MALAIAMTVTSETAMAAANAAAKLAKKLLKDEFNIDLRQQRTNMQVSFRICYFVDRFTCNFSSLYQESNKTYGKKNMFLYRL